MSKLRHLIRRDDDATHIAPAGRPEVEGSLAIEATFPWAGLGAPVATPDDPAGARPMGFGQE